ELRARAGLEGRRQEAAGLVEVEEEVRRAELQEVAGRTQPRDPEGRLDPARDDDLEIRRCQLDQTLELTVCLSARQRLGAVENEHHVGTGRSDAIRQGGCRV